MSDEIKLAELAQLKRCYEMGETHKAYNWALSPRGPWTDEQRAAYKRGYEGKPFKEGE